MSHFRACRNTKYIYIYSVAFAPPRILNVEDVAATNANVIISFVSLYLVLQIIIPLTLAYHRGFRN